MLAAVLGAVLLAMMLGPVTARQTHRKKPPAKATPKAAVAAAPKPTPTPIVPSPTDPPRISTSPIDDYGEVGHWRGDGNGADDTGKNPGTLTGGTSFAPAMSGRGFRFTGRDDSVRVADSYSLQLTKSLTINAWVNVDQFPTDDEGKGVIFFRGDDRGGLDPIVLSVGPDQRLTFHIESATDSVEISAPIPGHRFLMVTATLEATTGEMRLYENTVLVARTATKVRPMGDLDPTQHPGIGIGNCNAVPDSGYRFPFHGVINDMRVFSRVLAPGEMHAVYADCLSVPSPIQRHEGDN